MGEYPVQPSEDADEVFDARSSVIYGIPRGEAQPAGEDLLARDDVGRPVEGVAAVVNRAAALGGVVDRAQELPLAGAHLRAGCGGAWRVVEEEADNQVVAFVS